MNSSGVLLPYLSINFSSSFFLFLSNLSILVEFWKYGFGLWNFGWLWNFMIHIIQKRLNLYNSKFGIEFLEVEMFSLPDCYNANTSVLYILNSTYIFLKPISKKWHRISLLINDSIKDRQIHTHTCIHIHMSSEKTFFWRFSFGINRSANLNLDFFMATILPFVLQTCK